MKIEICVLIISCYITLIAAKCPLPSVIVPCTCYTYGNKSYINCGGNYTYDLKNMFTQLSSGLNETEKHYEEFYFNNTAINELPNNVFYDITFESVRIQDAYNLTKINTHAFVPIITHLKESAINTTEHLSHFTINNTPIGGNTSDTNNLFDVINSMINIQSLQIVNTSLTSIQTNAFTPLKSLILVYFSYNSRLKSIGNYAFYELNNLNNLFINNNSLELIGEHALSFRTENNVTLNIYIDMSNLTAKTLSNATFANINRRYALQLENNPQLKYLDDTVFNTVLANGNQIYVYNTRFECDCRMYWLYANRVQYEPLVHSAICSDGLSVFTSRQNYTKCSKDPLLL